MESKSIVVLGYHKIGEPPPDGWPTWSYVPVEIFDKHLSYINENGWQVLSLPRFLSALSDTSAFPEKSILITFDDGYLSTLKKAAPVLKKFNYPAVIFVPTSFVGSYNAFDADIFYEPKEPICSWEELQQLEEAGFSVQSHGTSHSHFSNISNEQLRREIIDSKLILEQHLAKRIETFAFPYGDSGVDKDETERILIDAGYKIAFIYNEGRVDLKNSHPFRIDRIPIGPDTVMGLILKH